MTVEVQNSEVEQVATVDQNQEVQAAQVKSKQDRNWEAMRERQRQLEQDLEQQRQMNAQLMNAIPQPKVEPDELDQLSDDEYLNKGKVSRMVDKKVERRAKEIAKQEVENILNQRDQANWKSKLTSQFPDFDDVVNIETMALLEQQDPELARTIVATKDPYKIGLQTYKYIKASKLDEQVPQSRRAKEVDEKLKENAKTVPSPQAYDKRPMAKAYQLTKSDMNDLYKEMTSAASQVGFSY